MIKYLIMDVDGTLTDGKIYMGENGELFKAFNVKDGCGIKNILPKHNIKPIIITSRISHILLNRCKELEIYDVYQGVNDKCRIIMNITEDFSECAYIGDDIVDLKCMNLVKAAGGKIGCPCDAVEDVKDIADFISKKNGGDGAVREFIEWLII